MQLHLMFIHPEREVHSQHMENARRV